MPAVTTQTRAATGAVAAVLLAPMLALGCAFANTGAGTELPAGHPPLSSAPDATVRACTSPGVAHGEPRTPVRAHQSRVPTVRARARVALFTSGITGSVCAAAPVPTRCVCRRDNAARATSSRRQLVTACPCWQRAAPHAMGWCAGRGRPCRCPTLRAGCSRALAVGSRCRAPGTAAGAPQTSWAPWQSRAWPTARCARWHRWPCARASCLPGGVGPSSAAACATVWRARPCAARRVLAPIQLPIQLRDDRGSTVWWPPSITSTCRAQPPSAPTALI